MPFNEYSSRDFIVACVTPARSSVEVNTGAGLSLDPIKDPQQKSTMMLVVKMEKKKNG